MALSSIVEWTIVGDQADVAHALSRYMIDRITDGIEHDAERQRDAKGKEGEETVDRNVSSSSRTREEILCNLGSVEEFIAGRGDRECLAYGLGLRVLYSTGT